MSLPMTPMQQSSRASSLRELLAYVETADTERACCYCEHFGERAFCLHWNANVPRKAQPNGCPQFLEEVPF